MLKWRERSCHHSKSHSMAFNSRQKLNFPLVVSYFHLLRIEFVKIAWSAPFSTQLSEAIKMLCNLLLMLLIFHVRFSLYYSSPVSNDAINNVFTILSEFHVELTKQNCYFIFCSVHYRKWWHQRHLWVTRNFGDLSDVSSCLVSFNLAL
jgi:hypothetical protein